MSFGPMTLIVLVAFGIAVVTGVWLIRRSAGDGRPGADRQVCRRCGTANAPRAGYCANCGLRLE